MTFLQIWNSQKMFSKKEINLLALYAMDHFITPNLEMYLSFHWNFWNLFFYFITFYCLWVTGKYKLAKNMAKETFILQTNSCDKWVWPDVFLFGLSRKIIWGTTLPSSYRFPMDKAWPALHGMRKIFCKSKTLKFHSEVSILLLLTCQYLRIIIPYGGKFEEVHENY